MNMICPKHKTCNHRYKIDCSPAKSHKENETCDYGNDHCPKCVPVALTTTKDA